MLLPLRYTNSTGTQLWPDYGPVFGALPEGSKQKMFYALLLRHLFRQHGYVPGKNFFIIPFDWRVGIQGLEQVRLAVSSVLSEVSNQPVPSSITCACFVGWCDATGVYLCVVCRLAACSGSLTTSHEACRPTVAKRPLL